MVDLTQPQTTAAEMAHGATPEEFTRRGVEPGLAAQLAAEHNRMTGRAPPPVKLPTPLNPTDAIGSSNEAASANELTAHLDAMYAPPAAPSDYKIPAASGTVTDEAFAADRALTQMLHGAGTPKDIGNALLADLATGRAYQHKMDDTPALQAWAKDLLTQARTVPELAPYARGLTPEALIRVMSPETLIALRPFVQHRAGKR